MKNLSDLRNTFYILPLLLIFGECPHDQKNSREDRCRRVAIAFQNNQFVQGSWQSQQLMDSLLAVCPTAAAILREKSVPFLKRGDFSKWYSLITKAVELEPKIYLPIRGWCLIKFLHDYEGGYKDLAQYDSLAPGEFKVVDDTHIKVWMALAKQGLHQDQEALQLFNDAISVTISTKGSEWVGTFDFLYRGILKLRLNDWTGAIQDFDSELRLYPNLADAFYYRGIALQQLGLIELACENFARASTCYEHGYYHSDPYVEMPGAIKKSNIDLPLKTCR